MKKLIAVLLVLALAVSMMALAGCSESNANNTNKIDAAGEEIKIGYIGPLTGNVSVYGIAVNRGLKLAVDEINAAGGLNGKKLVVVDKDDQGTAEEALNAFNSLVSEGVKIICGSVTSGCTAAITAAANEEHVLLIAAPSTADSITTEDDYIFRTCYSDSFQGAIASAYCYLNDIKKVGVVYCASDTYSKGLYDAFAAACEGYGIEIAAAESTDDATAVDFTNQFQSMVNAGVDTVFAPFYYSTIGPYLVPQARQAGYNGVILGADGYDGTIDYISSGMESYFNNVYFTNHYDPASEVAAVKDFVAAYSKANNGETPNSFAALAYDVGLVLKQAITETGSFDSTVLRDYLADTTRVYNCVTGNFTFDQSGTPVKGGVVTAFTYNEGDAAISTTLVQSITELP